MISISIINIILGLITMSMNFLTYEGRYISPIGEFLAVNEGTVLLTLYTTIILAIISSIVMLMKCKI